LDILKSREESLPGAPQFHREWRPNRFGNPSSVMKLEKISSDRQSLPHKNGQSKVSAAPVPMG
jgi:hypothetical protein